MRKWIPLAAVLTACTVTPAAPTAIRSRLATPATAPVWDVTASQIGISALAVPEKQITTPEPSPSPTEGQTPEATMSADPIPTATPEPSPSPTDELDPSAELAPEPTPEATEEPTPEPTPDPTPDPQPTRVYGNLGGMVN